MKRTPKTPALAKLAMLLLFAIATVAILDTTSISAQELGRTITSPFGIARQTSTSESGSNGDTFVDPETGEVGHIIRNPFGVANPEGVDTGIDIPENAGEEVGGIITSPFGVPASDDIDTGVDVFEEDEEYLISLPDDEESEVEESEDADEVDDETSDEVKVFEEESAETTTEKYVPVIDNPIRGVEHPSFNFELTCSSAGATVTDSGDVSVTPTLCVLPGKTIQTQAVLSEGSWPSGAPTWTLTCQTYESLPYGVSDLSLPSYANGMSNPPSITVPSGMPYRKYILTASAGNQSRSVQIVVLGKLDLQIDSNNDGLINDSDDSVEDLAPGKIIFINDGDLDEDGIPDCYDGFDIKVNGNGESQAGGWRSEVFTPIKIYLRGLSDLIASNQNVSIRFSYPAANPQNETITGAGTDEEPYVFSDSNKCLRIWTKDGTSQRNKESISSSGDFIPSDTPIPLSSYKNANVIASDTISLFMEAKNEPDTQNPVEITCSIKINSSTSNEMSDTVKVSSEKNFIKIIDVSGYARSNLNIERIPIDEDVDGIATDHLDKVNDGSALLICFAIPPSFENYFDIQSSEFIDFGGDDGTLKSDEIPPDVYAIPSGVPNYSIPHIGNNLPDERIVIKQAFYLPPLEMDPSGTINYYYRNIYFEANVHGKPNSSIGANGLYQFRRKIALTRPPLLMVHGINGTSESVFDEKGFTDAMEAAGIKAFGVDHNSELIDPFTENESGEYSNDHTYYGNGDIVKSYQFLRDRIYHNNSFLLSRNNSPARSAKIVPVLPMYRKGKAIKGKKIAIQKVDVVAYSYGGLLARWYVEESSEFENRRDVRKIITIGTPHRGSPIANMMCESYKNKLFADAFPGVPHIFDDSLRIKNIWGLLDIKKIVKWAKPVNGSIIIPELQNLNNRPWYEDILSFLSDPQNQILNWLMPYYQIVPGTDAAEDHCLYEALHVIAHGSKRIKKLNDTQNPLQPDVAYASIVGTKPSLESGLMEFILQVLAQNASSWCFSNPKCDRDFSRSFRTKSYFPWVEHLELTSDGIVPVDSQRLIDDDSISDPLAYVNIVDFVEESHLGEVGSDDTHGIVISWINSPNLWKGSDLQAHFSALTTHYNEEHENIFSEQAIDSEGKYYDTGVNHDSIVQTLLTMPLDNYSWDRPSGAIPTIPMLGPHGGVVDVICTGMIPSDSNLYVFVDGYDTDDNNEFVLFEDRVEVSSSLIGLKPFRITGKIGRSFDYEFDDEIRGPYGYVELSDPTEILNVVYRIGIGASFSESFYQSPPAKMTLSPAPPLDLIEGPSSFSDAAIFIAKGGFHVTDEALSSNDRIQYLHVEIRDRELLPYIEDDLLVEEDRFPIPIPLDSDVFPGILMPYAMEFSLFKNASGHVSGAQGSSGETTAEIYQKIFDFKGIAAIESKSGIRSISIED